MGNGEWRTERGLSWMHRKFRCWTVTAFVLGKLSDIKHTFPFSEVENI